MVSLCFIIWSQSFWMSLHSSRACRSCFFSKPTGQRTSQANRQIRRKRHWKEVVHIFLPDLFAWKEKKSRIFYDFCESTVLALMHIHQMSHMPIGRLEGLSHLRCVWKDCNGVSIVWSLQQLCILQWYSELVAIAETEHCTILWAPCWHFGEYRLCACGIHLG